MTTRTLAATAALTMALMGSACSDEASDQSAAGDVPAPPAESPYDYLQIAEELDGDVIPREDAAVRAMLLCDAEAPEDVLGGVPLSEFPTDLALVRAYCPDKER